MSDLQDCWKSKQEGFAAAADMIGKLLTAWEESQAELADTRVLLKDAMLAGAMMNETLNPLLDWDPRDKATRRKQWQAAEGEIGKYFARTVSQ